MKSSSSSSNNNVAEDLLKAAMEGGAEDAVQILRNEPELIRIGNASCDTAFHVAARAGHGTTVSQMIELLEKDHWELLKHVLRQGNAQGDTPLHLALKNGHHDTAVHLAQADRGATYMLNDDNMSPFKLATQTGNQEVLKLIQERAIQASVLPSDIEMNLARAKLYDDVDDTDDDDEEEEDWVRLFKAAAKGKDDIVVEILEEDQDIIHYEDTNVRTAFHVAASSGQVRTLKRMAEFMQNSSEVKKLMLKADCDQNTAVHLALQGGHESTARYLVEVAPRAIYKANQEGVSPLCLAVKRGYPELVGYMTRNDISSSIRDRILQHALNVSIAHTALKKRNLDVLKAILEGLPELINSTDRKGWSPLSYAAYKGYMEETCYILNSFPDSVSKEDDDGSFPIHKAFSGKHSSVIKEIVLHCPKALYDAHKNNIS